jgi:transposase InsO family protein
MGVEQHAGSGVLRAGLADGADPGPATAADFEHRSGGQFTSVDYVGAVEEAGVQVSMDGRGRWMDNRFVERLWRSLKYEDIYLRGYENGLELRQGVGHWFGDYNTDRPHQALGYATPAEVYHFPESYGAKPASWA